MAIIQAGYPNDFTTYSSTVAEFGLGDQVIVGGCTYEFVQISASSATAGSTGRVMFRTASAGIVSDDYTGGDGLNSAVAGVCVGTIAVSSYGFILVKGLYASVLKGTGAVTANDWCVPSSTDGKATMKTAGESTLAGVIGVWAASKSSGATSGAVFVNAR